MFCRYLSNSEFTFGYFSEKLLSCLVSSETSSSNIILVLVNFFSWVTKRSTIKNRNKQRPKCLHGNRLVNKNHMKTPEYVMEPIIYHLNQSHFYCFYWVCVFLLINELIILSYSLSRSLCRASIIFRKYKNCSCSTNQLFLSVTKPYRALLIQCKIIALKQILNKYELQFISSR